jgi:outer membrane protein
MSHSTRFARVAVAAVGTLFAAALWAGSASAAPPPPASTGNTPAPKILVIDKNQLLAGSKAAQDINRQGQAYLAAIQHDLKPEADALTRDKQTLMQQVAILSPDVKAKKIKDFQNRAQAFQQKAFKRQAQIQYGVYMARQELTRQLDPILSQLMSERGANLLLDRAAIIKGTNGAFDITRDAIARLDQKLPTVKVQLTDPPPDVLRQMMQQSQQQQQ